MKKFLKKGMVFVLSITIILSLAIPAFAAKTEDSGRFASNEFGYIEAWENYAGLIYGRKTVNFSTTIGHLSYSGVNTTVYASVEIKAYYTGEYLDRDRAPIVTNKTSTGYYWEGHNDTVNTIKISSFGTHEARANESAVAYTEIYGF